MDPVVNSFVMPDCMPTGVTQGPGNNFLVGCADHDGEAFPPNEYIINGTTGTIITEINNVGGVDETWYNPTDNKYYLAARDMPNGPVLGVIDAVSNLWLENVTTNSNSHSIAVDPSNNHVFVPLQSRAESVPPKAATVALVSTRNSEPEARRPQCERIRPRELGALGET